MGYVFVCVQQPYKDGGDFRRTRASRNTRGAVLFLSQRKVSSTLHISHSLSSSYTYTHKHTLSLFMMHVLPKAPLCAVEKSKAPLHSFRAFLNWNGKF